MKLPTNIKIPRKLVYGGLSVTALGVTGYLYLNAQNHQQDPMASLGNPPAASASNAPDPLLATDTKEPEYGPYGSEPSGEVADGFGFSDNGSELDAVIDDSASGEKEAQSEPAAASPAIQHANMIASNHDAMTPSMSASKQAVKPATNQASSDVNKKAENQDNLLTLYKAVNASQYQVMQAAESEHAKWIEAKLKRLELQTKLDLLTGKRSPVDLPDPAASKPDPVVKQMPVLSPIHLLGISGIGKDLKAQVNCGQSTTRLAVGGKCQGWTLKRIDIDHVEFVKGKSRKIVSFAAAPAMSSMTGLSLNNITLGNP